MLDEKTTWQECFDAGMTAPHFREGRRMNPPAHICGPKLTRAARDERDRWIAAAPRHLSNARIAALLGISPAAVLHACPDRAGKIPVRVMPPQAAAVSLPPVPGIEITSARPETNPRAGIVTPARKSLTIEERIEVIRQMWISTRAAA